MWDAQWNDIIEDINHNYIYRNELNIKYVAKDLAMHKILFFFQGIAT